MALQLRDIFAKSFPTVSAKPRQRLSSVQKNLSAVELTAYILATVEGDSPEDDVKDTSNFMKLLTAWKKAAAHKITPCLLVFAAIANIQPDDQFDALNAVFLQVSDTNSPGLVWTQEKYTGAMDKTPELKELLTTPFMLQVTCQFDLFSLLRDLLFLTYTIHSLHKNAKNNNRLSVKFFRNWIPRSARSVTSRAHW